MAIFHKRLFLDMLFTESRNWGFCLDITILGYLVGCLLACPSPCPLVGLLVGQLVGRSVGRSEIGGLGDWGTGRSRIWDW